MSASEAALIDLQPGPSIHGLLDASETSPSSLPSPLGKPPSCETSSASNNSSSRSLSTTDSEDEGWGEVEQLLIDVSALSKTRKSINCEEEKEASSLSLAHALLARPSDLLSREETALLWAQREGLVQDGRALVKLLRAVLAYGPLEGSVDVDGAGLIGMWATAGCGLTAVDAMKLLGRYVLSSRRMSCLTSFVSLLAHLVCMCQSSTHTLLKSTQTLNCTQARPRPHHPGLRHSAAGTPGGRRASALPSSDGAAAALRALGGGREQQRQPRGGIPAAGSGTACKTIAPHEHAAPSALPD